VNLSDRLAARRDLRAGLRLLAGDRPAEAADRLRRAETHDPGNPLAPLHLARALARLDRADEARAACERALARRPDAPAFLILAGEVLLDAGRPAEAREHFLRALRRSPRNRLARAYAALAAWRATGRRDRLEALARRGLVDSDEFLARLLLALEWDLRRDLFPPAAPARIGAPRRRSPLRRYLSVGAKPCIAPLLGRGEGRDG